MLCYTHQDRQAVGICKSCQKGLCPECATEVGQSLACKGHCESDVEFLNNSINANREAYAVARSNSGMSAVLYVAMGLFFILVGLMTRQVQWRMLMCAFGLVFFGAAVKFYRNRNRWPKL